MNLKAIAIILTVVVILGEGIAILWFWKERDVAARDLIAEQRVTATQKTQIEADAKTIAAITKYDQENDKILAAYVKQMSGIDRLYGELQNSINELRLKDAAVNDYLKTPIPPALLCILNGVCPQGTVEAGSAK